MYFFIDDYFKVFGNTLESIFGVDWSELLRNLLLNKMDNIFTRPLFDGSTLFFMKIPRFREKLHTVKQSADLERILQQLNIDPKNIKQYRGKNNNRPQNSFNRYLNLYLENVCVPCEKTVLIGLSINISVDKWL